MSRIDDIRVELDEIEQRDQTDSVLTRKSDLLAELEELLELAT